ncbi:glycosyltransferase [Dyadobacter chenwenxiniae]|uniref:Glycosyltransferase n=1 Tax=Dyadobacter chenwenxiniae TaxID=2906456 RepID=A0A9X1PK47_9BACT|nr:glycosyltransferase [Dyadobacter chenwenxiniae]MCF0060216.1 glycosyltransferase [Dyadobacter chenwenxiniae]UON85953.1 glycosyltransferase [Dyadobacter chenwenxiniae]
MLQTGNRIKVSVLVAARNEENNIERCLKSLNELNFPKENIEIIIGDDDSDDLTEELIARFIWDKAQFKCIKITKQIAGLKGKANVLAQLAHEAKGEYFFYCDADIAVRPTWISAMLRHFKEKTGVVVGLTRMKRSNLLADLLSTEWLFALSVARFFSLFKIPMTGMGNNMAVAREAYFAVGGYEKLGFSIVEDYTLFMGIAKGGYDFKMAYHVDILNVSEPVTSFSELIKQRRRWMQGVMQSFWVTKWTLILSSLIVPIFLILSIWFPVEPLIGIGRYYLLITIISLFSIVFLKQYDLWKAALLFWFHMTLIGWIMLANYLLPGKTVWKGREY